MKRYYVSLSQKDRRRYAAVEALKLGYGGMKYIAELFECSRKTIEAGLKEISSERPLAEDCIRSPGGGRKNAWEIYPDLDRLFLLAIAPHQIRRSRGSIVSLTRRQIAEKLQEKGVTVSLTVVDQLVKKHRVIRKLSN